MSKAKTFVGVLSSEEEDEEVQFVPYTKPAPPVIELLSEDEGEEGHDKESNKQNKRLNEFPACDANAAQPSPPIPCETSTSSAGNNVGSYDHGRAIARSGITKVVRRESDADRALQFGGDGVGGRPSSSEQIYHASDEGAPCIPSSISIYEFPGEALEAPVPLNASNQKQKGGGGSRSRKKGVGSNVEGNNSVGEVGKKRLQSRSKNSSTSPKKRATKRQSAKQRTDLEIRNFLTTLLGNYPETDEMRLPLPPVPKRTKKGQQEIVIENMPSRLIPPFPDLDDLDPVSVVIENVVQASLSSSGSTVVKEVSNPPEPVAIALPKPFPAAPTASNVLEELPNPSTVILPNPRYIESIQEEMEAKKISTIRNLAASNSLERRTSLSDPPPLTSTIAQDVAATEPKSGAKNANSHLQKPSYFPSHWTAEMITYFDTTKDDKMKMSSVLSNMRDDKALWKTNEHKFSRDIPKRVKMRCTNCNQYGHLARACTEKRRIPVCHYCGRRGHNIDGKCRNNYCPHTLCLVCGRKQSKMSHGCYRCTHTKNPLICKTCDMVGHDSSRCPDNWRRFCQTTELVEDENNSLKPFGDLVKYRKHFDSFCANCGNKGHNFYHCRLSNKSSNYSRQNPRIFVELPRLPPKIATSTKVGDQQHKLSAPVGKGEMPPMSSNAEGLKNVEVHPEPKKTVLDSNLMLVDEGLADISATSFALESTLENISAIDSVQRDLVKDVTVPEEPSSNDDCINRPQTSASHISGNENVRTVTASSPEFESISVTVNNTPTTNVVDTIDLVENENASYEEILPITATTTKCFHYPDCKNTVRAGESCITMFVVPSEHRLLVEAQEVDNVLSTIQKNDAQVTILQSQSVVHVYGANTVQTQVDIMKLISNLKSQISSSESNRRVESATSSNAPEVITIEDEDEGEANKNIVDQNSTECVTLLGSEWGVIFKESLKPDGLIHTLSQLFKVNIYISKEDSIARIQNGTAENRMLAKRNIVIWLECMAAGVRFELQRRIESPPSSMAIYSKKRKMNPNPKILELQKHAAERKRRRKEKRCDSQSSTFPHSTPTSSSRSPKKKNQSRRQHKRPHGIVHEEFPQNGLQWPPNAPNQNFRNDSYFDYNGGGPQIPNFHQTHQNDGFQINTFPTRMSSDDFHPSFTSSPQPQHLHNLHMNPFTHPQFEYNPFYSQNQWGYPSNYPNGDDSRNGGGGRGRNLLRYYNSNQFQL